MKAKSRAIVPLIGLLWFTVLTGPAWSGEPARATGGRERLDTLRAEIAHHDDLYFKQAAPEISDADYDRLKRELQALAHAHPEWGRPGAIGDDRSGRFPVVAHRERMLSLDKAYAEADWRKFYAGVARRLGRREVRFVLEPKYDGLAISLVYERGRLVRAVTRGNGREGDDVTDNIRTIRALPYELAIAGTDGIPRPIPEWVELRGEVYIDTVEFRRLNATREQAGDEPFAHPRNLAAGTIKSLDPTEVATRKLSIVIHGWGDWQGAGQPASQQEFQERVRAWGLPGAPAFAVVYSAEEGWAAIRRFELRRATLGFPVDGVVLKLDEVAAREKLGAGEQAPRWAVAFKYTPARAVARIRAISIQVGRTGVLTPVAEFEPVELEGTKVSRATLHNRTTIARRDIRIGDFVEVEKAGEVIPAVVAVRFELRPAGTEPFEFPGHCPSCGESVASRPDEAAVRCENVSCPEQRQRRLEHFASAAAVDIAGLGPGTIAALVRARLVATPSDFYRLRSDDMDEVEGLGPVRAKHLLADIERSRQAELWRFIHGLGIPQIGPVNSRRLAETCGGLENLANRNEAEHAVVVGASAGRSVAAFLARPQNRAELQALVDCGLRPSVPPLPVAAAGLRGKVVSFTGTLPGLTREVAAERVRAAGGIVRDNVTSSTSYLVTGSDPGQKANEARRLGVAIISAEEFLQLFGAD